MASPSKVVVVTGASAGVGRATVREFAKHGFSVGLIARGTQGLEAARRECEAMGSKALALSVDVTDHKGLNNAADEIESKLGPIDVWVNCAMTTIFAPFLEIDPEDFHRATEVTYLGFVYGTMAALHRMVSRNRGIVVQVGSALGYRSIPLQSAYCGAKHAINGFTDSIRTELMHNKSKVRITIVQMPGLNTPQFDWCKTLLPKKAQPVPPIYQPEIAARAIYWAAHHKRREVLVGMSTVITILGNKLLPGLGDYYLAKKGYQSQQYDGPVDPNRPDNLYKPVEGDFGAQGSFSGRAVQGSKQLFVETLPGIPVIRIFLTGAMLLWAAKKLIFCSIKHKGHAVYNVSETACKGKAFLSALGCKEKWMPKKNPLKCVIESKPK